MDFSDKRQSYEKGMLDPELLPQDAISLVTQWFNEALDAQVKEPYAMSVATCGQDMQPAVRIVLMREITDNGIIFYTNYESAKGQDIAENPKAEALFFWYELERQIRIRGTIAKISAVKSDAYFQKRPHDSQVGAWVSQPQSGEVASRDIMENEFAKLQATYPAGTTVPTPEFWGGYEICADEIEFWQGRANRMHDRIVYQKNEDGSWSKKRLLP